MKSLAIVIVSIIVLGVCLAMPSNQQVAFAAVYFHGDFTSDSQSCGGCHITHGAATAQLLVRGPTETDFCYYCHGEGRGTSGYDVETGMITGQGVKRPSYAGGFRQSIDPSRSTVGGQVYNNTSVHGIEKAMRLGSLDELPLDGDIPGGGSWAGSFKCGSCHDPHAGGQYPSVPYKNPRLLRMTLLDTTARAVYMYIDYSQTQLPLEYGSGFNRWCGGCHDAFNTEGAGRTGSIGYSNGSVMKFRHEVGVNIPDKIFSTDLGFGLPISTNTNGAGPGAPQWKLDCLTCHRAHGSSVNVSVGFSRFKTYNAVDNFGANEVQSALLRLPDRGVCSNCHGSAEYNAYNDN